jgi:hypothetical protein
MYLRIPRKTPNPINKLKISGYESAIASPKNLAIATAPKSVTPIAKINPNEPVIIAKTII